jgi:hypothetical protein
MYFSACSRGPCEPRPLPAANYSDPGQMIQAVKEQPIGSIGQFQYRECRIWSQAIFSLSVKLTNMQSSISSATYFIGSIFCDKKHNADISLSTSFIWFSWSSGRKRLGGTSGFHWVYRGQAAFSVDKRRAELFRKVTLDELYERCFQRTVKLQGRNLIARSPEVAGDRIPARLGCFV